MTKNMDSFKSDTSFFWLVKPSKEDEITVDWGFRKVSIILKIDRPKTIIRHENSRSSSLNHFILSSYFSGLFNSTISDTKVNQSKLHLVLSVQKGTCFVHMGPF